GRTIPFTNSKYDNADITSQIVKEAVFDILFSKIRGSSFLDLFSCSGQIGLEAISRGASFVWMNERDRKRFSFIRRMVDDMKITEGFSLTSFDAFRVIRESASAGKTFDIIYLDPPYHKFSGDAPVYADLLEKIDTASLLSDDGVIVVQHFSQNILPESEGGLVKTDSRKYGQNVLTFYEKKRNVDTD
ncbi:MAG TPA: RsmD family RNA methyltransferase, partial [Spirochaetota bacterium]|nr:RsmD family RNA methyltransferase [Spirochaetota bacterium]